MSNISSIRPVVSVQYRLVTDIQTDGHTTTANAALAERRAVKMSCAMHHKLRRYLTRLVKDIVVSVAIFFFKFSGAVFVRKVISDAIFLVFLPVYLVCLLIVV